MSRVRRARKEGKNPKSCDEVFERLITEGVDPDDLYHEMTHQVGGQIANNSEDDIITTRVSSQVHCMQSGHSKIRQSQSMYGRGWVQ